MSQLQKCTPQNFLRYQHLRLPAPAPSSETKTEKTPWRGETVARDHEMRPRSHVSLTRPNILILPLFAAKKGGSPVRIGCFALVAPFSPMRRQFELIRQMDFNTPILPIITTAEPSVRSSGLPLPSASMRTHGSFAKWRPSLG